MWTYATVGMSQPGDACPIELHMFSPVRSDLLVELLFATAHYHRTGASLGLDDTVNFGRPWLEGSECDHGLISLPYLDGPSLENLNAGGGSAKFYWLLPVTRSEVDFKARFGVDALESEMERQRFNYLDPARKPVA
jgi:hypothetical protein